MPGNGFKSIPVNLHGRSNQDFSLFSAIVSVKSDNSIDYYLIKTADFNPPPNYLAGQKENFSVVVNTISYKPKRHGELTLNCHNPSFDHIEAQHELGNTKNFKVSNLK